MGGKLQEIGDVQAGLLPEHFQLIIIDDEGQGPGGHLLQVVAAPGRDALPRVEQVTHAPILVKPGVGQHVLQISRRHDGYGFGRIQPVEAVCRGVLHGPGIEPGNLVVGQIRGDVRPGRELGGNLLDARER